MAQKKDKTKNKPLKDLDGIAGGVIDRGRPYSERMSPPADHVHEMKISHGAPAPVPVEVYHAPLAPSARAIPPTPSKSPEPGHMQPDPHSKDHFSSDRPRRFNSSVDLGRIKRSNSLVDVRGQQNKDLEMEFKKLNESLSAFHVQRDILKSRASKLSNDSPESRATAKQLTILESQMMELDGRINTYNSLGSFEERYDFLQPGRIDAMESAARKLDRAISSSGENKLLVLGRLEETTGIKKPGDQPGRDSWLASNMDEAGRVLNEEQWSMAVNDAFIKAGLDQKAQFSLITQFKEEVKSKIKELLLTNPDATLTAEEKKAEIRRIAKEVRDKALYHGGDTNDGFAISMLELEHIIDDGYVMMEHDPNARKVDKLDDLKPVPVMVPSGFGQAIKRELKWIAALIRRKTSK